MKRLTISVAVMLATYALGVGVDRLIALQLTVATPSPEPVAVEQSQFNFTTPAIPIATVVPAPTPAIRDYHTGDPFVPDGYYSIIGRKPTQFSEFDTFQLAYDLEPQGYNMWITTDNGAEVQAATFGVITQRRLFFISPQTSGLGFEYRFDGEFVRTDFDSVSGKNKPVLRGMLTKFRGGQKVAEMEVSFDFERSGC